MKNSVLCVGLDPALPEQRDNNVISENYLVCSESESRLNFCLDIIEHTCDFCCAYKPNNQYIAGFTENQHKKLTNAIRRVDAISILDYKLNDIGATVDSALFHTRRWGYDAVTFNPLLGNIETTIDLARLKKPELGIIVLVLTSNKEALKYLKGATIKGEPLYISIAEDVRRYDADGCVVGATGHITEAEIKRIRATVGEDCVLLIPGIGAQKGDPTKVINAGGKNILINVGRDIIYHDNPKERAKEYNHMFNEIRMSLS